MQRIAGAFEVLELELKPERPRPLFRIPSFIPASHFFFVLLLGDGDDCPFLEESQYIMNQEMSVKCNENENDENKGDTEQRK